MAGEQSWAEQSWAERIGGVIGVLLALIGMGWGIWWCAGCGKNSDPPQPPAIQKSKFDLAPPPKLDSPDDQDEFGPLADARERVKKFEKKRAALQPLLDKALGDRDELVTKLREAGVTRPTDLKGNRRGQKLAESLTKLGAEIEGLERQIAAVDAAILEAKAVVRRLERERAGISDEEMRKLAEQLREVEERTEGAARNPVTPLDVDAALDKALKASSRQKEKTTPRQGASKLVGKWRIDERRRKGTIEFASGGTALLAWDQGFTNGLGQRMRRATLKYTLMGNMLRFEEPGSSEYRQKFDVQIEFVSDDEMIFVNQKNSLSFDWLGGRVKRVKEIDAAHSDALKVDARTLVKAYTEDKDAADKKYKGKILEVTGVVTYRRSTGINLEAGTDFKTTVMCAFGAERAKALREIWRQVGKGARVTVKGTCNGFSTKTGSHLVTLDNCDMIDPPLPTR